MKTASRIRGFYVCRRCGKKVGQSTYDCDIAFVCSRCITPEEKRKQGEQHHEYST